MSALAAKKVNGAVRDLLSPRAAAWKDAPEAVLPLQPTPLDVQPSAYVQTAWTGRERGNVASVSVRALAAGGQLLVRLQWSANDPRHSISDNDAFADACAILFPSDGKDAELATMGSEAKPVTAWYWRSGTPAPYMATARGLGTVTRVASSPLTAAGEWAAGQWQVVVAGPAPAAAKLGVAVWSGAASERAGLKSHTPSWHDLKVG